MKYNFITEFEKLICKIRKICENVSHCYSSLFDTSPNKYWKPAKTIVRPISKNNK